LSTACQMYNGKEEWSFADRLPTGAISGLQAARMRADTEEYQQLYAKRAGVEGAISQAARTIGLRRSRYRGSNPSPASGVCGSPEYRPVSCLAARRTSLLSWRIRLSLLLPLRLPHDFASKISSSPAHPDTSPYSPIYTPLSRKWLSGNLSMGVYFAVLEFAGRH
jgi:hypothetical protein